MKKSNNSLNNKISKNNTDLLEDIKQLIDKTDNFYNMLVKLKLYDLANDYSNIEKEFTSLLIMSFERIVKDKEIKSLLNEDVKGLFEDLGEIFRKNQRRKLPEGDWLRSFYINLYERIKTGKPKKSERSIILNEIRKNKNELMKYKFATDDDQANYNRVKKWFTENQDELNNNIL